MSLYRSKRRPSGTCDRCGRSFAHSDLAEQWDENGPTGLMVCRPCEDGISQFDRLLEMVEFDDPKPLNNARPDKDVPKGFSCWDPVGGDAPLQLEIGQCVAGG